ncbi:DUF3828 domain-containing protein [Azospirillum doebereinerae]|nr:DUF3828 domain-containing protein [Azospirillum doebereinerae]
MEIVVNEKSKYKLRIWQDKIDLVIRASALEEAADLARRLSRQEGDLTLIVETWDPSAFTWNPCDTIQVPGRGVDTKAASGGTAARSRLRGLATVGVAAVIGALVGGGALYSGLPGRMEPELTAVPVQPSPPAEPVAKPDAASRGMLWLPSGADFEAMAADVGAADEENHGMEGPWALPGGVIAAYWGQCGGSGCVSKGWTFVQFQPDGQTKRSESVSAPDNQVPKAIGQAIHLNGANENGRSSVWMFQDGVLRKASEPIPMTKLSDETCRSYHGLIERECAPSKACADATGAMSNAGSRDLQWIQDTWPARGVIFEKMCESQCRRRPVTLAQFAKSFCQIPPDPAIEQLFRKIYATYVESSDKEPYPQFNRLSDMREVFSEDIVKALQWDAENNKGDVGTFDFNFFIAGQDWELRKIPTFSIEMLDSQRASVLAEGINDLIGPKSKIEFSMIQTALGWRINNIRWPKITSDLMTTIRTIRKPGKSTL